MKEKIAEIPLRCDRRHCEIPIRHDSDIVVIYYSRGNAIEAFASLNRMNDKVEVFHVNCLPDEIHDRLNKEEDEE